MDPQLPTTSRPFFNRTFLYVLVLAILLAAALVAYFVWIGNKPSTQGSGYVEGLSREKITIALLGNFYRYPNGQSVAAQPSTTVNLNVFEGLVRWRNNKAVPALAESWTNPDQLTWRFNLRKDVKFHSGAVFKAEDVKYSIDQAKANKEWGSNSLTSVIKSVTVIDDNTVEIKTEKPTPGLLYNLVLLFIVSKEQVTQAGLANAVGTGAYKIVSLKESEVVEEANQSYWGGAPKVRQLVYKYYKDRDAEVVGLEQGDVDLIAITNKSKSDELKTKGYQVVAVSSGDMSVVGFDFATEKAKYVEGAASGKNPFKDPKVRKALWAAIDASSVVLAGGINGVPLSQFSTPDLVGYNLAISKHTQDVSLAKSLLTEAGYPTGFTFTILVPTTGEDFAKEIAKQLAAINVTMKLNIVDFSKYVDKLGAGADPKLRDFTAYYLTQDLGTLDSLDYLNDLVHSTKGTNSLVSMYSSPALDSIIDQADKEFDLKKRTELTQKAQEQVNNELPYLLLYTKLTFYVTKEDVSFKSSPGANIPGYELSGRRKTDSNQ